MTLELVEKFKPVIHVPKEDDDRKLIDVRYEIFPQFAVLWYHWPFDDETGKEDYEPVVLIFRDDNLVEIAIRPHEKHTHSRRWLAEGVRPVIVFETSWHGPKIYRGRIGDALTAVFASSLISEKMEDYALVQGRPPDWYIKDGTEVEIYEYAQFVLASVS